MTEIGMTRRWRFSGHLRGFLALLSGAFTRRAPKVPPPEVDYLRHDIGLPPVGPDWRERILRY